MQPRYGVSLKKSHADPQQLPPRVPCFGGCESVNQKTTMTPQPGMAENTCSPDFWVTRMHKKVVLQVCRSLAMYMSLVKPGDSVLGCLHKLAWVSAHS